MGAWAQRPALCIQPMRFVTCSILLRCEHCGGGLPVQGPLRKVPCPACQKVNSLGASRVVEYLQKIADGSTGFLSSREGEVRFGHHDFHPCAECGAEVPLRDLPVGAESVASCAKCAAPLESFPAPQWLAEELPGVVQLFGAAREPGERPADALPLPASKVAAPVVMQCPKCNAALELTVDSRRTTTCSFCQANVYLPDELWRQLHPVETTRFWTWASRGPLKSKRELRGEENARRHREEPMKGISMWVCASMPPGKTYWPEPSTTVVPAGTSRFFPMALMTPSAQ